MKKALYIILASLLLTMGWGAYLYYAEKSGLSLQRYMEVIQSKFDQDYQAVTQTLGDEKFNQYAFDPNIALTNQDYVKELYHKDYTLLAYKNDSLITWTNNKLFLTKALLDSFPEGDFEAFVHLPNAYGYVVKREWEEDGSRKLLFGLIPIKYDYSFKKLKKSNKFVASDKIPIALQISRSAKGLPMTLPDKTKIYIWQPANYFNSNTRRILIWLFGLGYLLFLGILNYFAQIISERNPMQGATFLLATSALLMIILYFFNPMTNIQGDDSLVKALGIEVMGTSLAVVILFNITFLWLMIHLNKTFVFKRKITLKYPYRIAIAFLLNVFLFLGILFVLKVFEEIIDSAGIEISFLNLLKGDYSTILGLLALLMSLTGLVLFILWIIRFLERLDLRMIHLSITSIVSFVMVYATMLVSGLSIGASPGYYMAVLIFAPSALSLFAQNNRRREPFEIYVWFIAMAIFAAGTITFFKEQREVRDMHRYAKVLSEERDTLLENSVVPILDSIRQDSEWSSLFRPLFFNYNHGGAELMVLEHLESRKYITNNYSPTIYLFPYSNKDESDDESLFDEQTFTKSEYKRLLADAFQVPGKEGIYIKNFPSEESYSYFFERTLPLNGEKALFVLRLDSKLSESRKVNSSLFSSNEGSFRLKNLNKYEYATFKDGKCIRKRGNIENVFYELPHPKKEDTAIQKKLKQSNYYIYKSKSGNIVVIHQKHRSQSLLPFLSLFALLFFLISSISFIINFINKLLRFIPGTLELKMLPNNSLYTRLQSTFLVIIYFALIVFGIVTATYFNSSNMKYHDGRLARKSRTIEKQLGYFLLEIPKTRTIKEVQEKIADQLEKISDINKMDALNLFDPSGRLIATTKDEIFVENVTPPTMDPMAYSYFRNNHIPPLNREQIGDVHFKTSYIPLYHFSNIVSYLGIPYYIKKDARLGELSNFVSNILIGYLFIFFIGMAVVIYRSKVMYKPIQKLSNDIQRGDELAWEGDDKFFKEFVEVYNKSLSEKEARHQLQLQVERESAWRDLAKQVAHDIKNPLTPIKLHIQHFQQTIMQRKLDLEQIEQRTKKVTDIILTQIELLVRKLDNFRAMANEEDGNLNKKNVLLNEILLDIAELYKASKDVTVSLELPKEQVYVWGDYGQLERVFNNLVKNAQQAIPEDKHGRIMIRLFVNEDNDAVIEVHDNGQGIPNEMIDKIFEPNFTTKSSGTGLGLHICKSILTNHKGDIYFDTKLGEGTTFYVRLKTSRVMNELNGTPA